MPDFYVRMLGALKEQMTANMSRSDVLRPLYAVLALLSTLLVLVLFAKGPTWLLIGIFILICLDLLLTGCAYAFFARTDPAALRSESYSLRKLAIEQGYLGDDVAGLFGSDDVKADNPNSAKTIEHKR